jgi:hypothetical protein
MRTDTRTDMTTLTDAYSQILQRADLSLCDYLSRAPIAAKSTCQLRHVQLPLSLFACDGSS